MIRGEADRTRYAVDEGIRRANHVMEENELRQRELALDPERSRVGKQLISLLAGRMVHAPTEPGVVRDATGRVIQITGVNHVPFGSQKDKPKSREQTNLLAKYDLVFDSLEGVLAVSPCLRDWDTLKPQDVFSLDIRGDQRFQAILEEMHLKRWPALFVRLPGQEMKSNIVEASVLSRTEKGKPIETICFSMEQITGEAYRKIYLPEPYKSEMLPWVDLNGWGAPPNARGEWRSDHIRLGDLDEQRKGFELEGVQLFTVCQGASYEENVIYMNEVRLPKGRQQFFYRSGSMFSREEAEKLQNVLAGPEQLSYAPTAKELELVSALGSYPQAALEGIKEEMERYPDPASLKLRRGEKVACFGRDDTANVRMGIGTRDKLTVVLAGLDVRQLAQLVSKGEFHFSALDKCLLGGMDSLVLQASSPEPGEIIIKVAVVRLVEGKNQYADSLASSRAVIEGFQSNCPGFSVDVLRQGVSNALGKRSALAYIVSQLQPFEEQLLSQRAEQRRRAEREEADARAARYNPRVQKPRYW